MLRVKHSRACPLLILPTLRHCEGGLQAARLGRGIWTLPLPPSEIASYLPTLGRVKSLTRSRLAVLEQTGDYPELRGGAQTGLLLDPGGLDLRLLYSHWHWVCLIRDAMPSQDGSKEWRWSLQILNQPPALAAPCTNVCTGNTVPAPGTR